MNLTDSEAYRFAEKWHQGQHRKGIRQQKFIEHPLRVALLLTSHGLTEETLLNAALLHDVLEDTPCPREQMAEIFGTPVLKVVLELTDDQTLLKSERKQRQVERAGYLSPHAGLIRLADKIDNVASLTLDPPGNWGWPRQRAYVAWADRVVRRIPDPHPALLHRFQEARARAWARVTGAA